MKSSFLINYKEQIFKLLYRMKIHHIAIWTFRLEELRDVLYPLL